jgi:hypothetical protein
MRVSYLQASFVFLAIAVFAPGAATAQVNNQCETFYCTAYASYDSASYTISGYLEYYDDTEDVNLGIDAYFNGTYIGSADGVDDVYCDFSGLGPTSNGTWGVIGYVWYNEGEDVDDGSIGYDVLVMRIPTGETNAATDPAPAGYVGSAFDVTLTPSTFSFDGYQVSEAFNSSASDTCSSLFGLGQPLGNPQPSSYTVTSNMYGDTIAVPSAWVNDYQAHLGAGQSCNWSTTQTVSYNGTQYIQNTVAVTITSNTACATRAGSKGVGCP